MSTCYEHLRKKKLERIQINFTQAQLQLLKNESEKTGVSIAGLVRLAINDQYNKEGC